MKRIVLTILALVGVGGVVALMRYYPSQASPSAGNSTGSAATPADSPSSGGSAATSAAYKDGTYNGSSVDVGYGMVQVQAVVSGGRLTAVKLLQMPSDARHSQEVAAFAGPQLVQEAITAQSAQVDIVTGATQDSEGFISSLQSALSKAKA
jgi:uncharacterized protein with FMN-binding domain